MLATAKSTRAVVVVVVVVMRVMWLQSHSLSLSLMLLLLLRLRLLLLVLVLLLMLCDEESDLTLLRIRDYNDENGVHSDRASSALTWNYHDRRDVIFLAGSGGHAQAETKAKKPKKQPETLEAGWMGEPVMSPVMKEEKRDR